MVDQDNILQTIFTVAETEGSYEANGYRLELGAEGDPAIHVREVETGLVVAYSSMAADYEASMEEFITDYLMVGPLPRALYT